MEKNIVLKCDNISKSFGKKRILDKVSLEVYEGDILGFIGPNGAGKTTTIKLILGLQSIDSGKVVINGFDVKNDFIKAINKVGAIVENPDLYMYLSGYANLKLVANIYHVSDERIEEVIELIGLSKRIKDKVNKYSLGMRQRLGIGCALLSNPKLLILDEPTSGLDPEGIKEIRELLVSLAKKEKMAILISSHILSELESFCNKICIIKNGKIIEETEIANIKKNKDDICYIIELDNIKDIDIEHEEIEDNKIRVHCRKDEIPKIIKKLIKDRNIYGVYEEVLSLEEAFLKRTGGNIIE